MPALGINATWGATEWAAYVLEHLNVDSVLLRSGARLVPVNGKSLKLPRSLTDGTAAWVAELAEIPSDSPTGDLISLDPMKVGNTVVLSAESIEDAPVSELDATGVALARSVAKAIDAAAFSAAVATATVPAGLLSTTYAIQTQSGGVGDVDTFLSAIGKIVAVGGNANAIYANPADWTALTLVKEATGSERGLLQPDPTQPNVYRIGGAVLYPTPAIAAGKALVADSSQIVVGIRRDITVAFSGDAKFTADGTVAKVTARVDWDLNDSRGLCIAQT